MGPVLASLIHNKQLCPGRRGRAVRFGLVGHLVADPRREDKLAAIGQLGVQFTFQAEQDVAFCAPMVSQVAGTIFHHAHPNIFELLRATGSHACFPGM